MAQWAGEDLLPGLSEVGHPRSPVDDLHAPSYPVWSAVPVRGGATTERIAAAAGMQSRTLIGILATLEAHGLVRREAGLWRKAARSGGPRP